MKREVDLVEFRFPLRVVVMDDDYFALKGVAGLLSRDLRTMVCGECDSAEALIQTLTQLKQPPDIVLIDAEYRQDAITLPDLMARTRKLCGDAVLICWSQYGEPDAMRSVVAAGADGILIKKEVRLAIATDLVRAWHRRSAWSPSVAQILGADFDEWLTQGGKMEPWEPHPDLSPRLKQVFWLCIVYGMNVRDAAAEMHVQPETVERYRMKIYDIMNDGWVDDSYLQDAWQRIQQDRESDRGISRAYHLLTQPPRE